MKNFLKSTAIFACIALMFCACSEDDTEQSGGGVGTLMPAEDLTIQAGDQRIFLTWIVSDDSEVTRSSVAWTNNEGTSGSDYFDVTPGEEREYQLLNLPIGTYTITINSMDATSKVLYTGETSIYVYSSDTYGSEWPTVESAISVGDDVYVTWANVHEDCYGIVVSYYTSATSGAGGGRQPTSRTVSTDFLSLDEPAILTEPRAGTEFSYAAYFKPEGGLDSVAVGTSYNDGVYTISEAPTAPSSVSVLAGNERFVLTWTMPTNDSLFLNMDHTTINYVGGEKDVTIEIPRANMVQGVNTYEVNFLDAVEYEISIYNVCIDTYTASSSQRVTASVYNDADYGRSWPVVKGVRMISSEDESGLKIVWSEVPDDCVGVIYNYCSYLTGGNYKYSDLTAIAAGSASYDVITDMLARTQFYFTSYFCPTDGLDTIALAHNSAVELFSIDTEPDAPTNLVVSPGYDDTAEGDNSLLNLSWEHDNDLGNIYTIYAFYTQEDGEEQSENMVASVTQRSHNITSLLVNTTYSVYLASVSEYGVYYRSDEVVSATTYNQTYYDEYDGEVALLPTLSATVANDYAYLSYEGEFHEDLQDITITYNETTTDISLSLLLSGAAAFAIDSVSTFSYSANLLPAGGYSEISVTSDELDLIDPDGVFSTDEE